MRLTNYLFLCCLTVLFFSCNSHQQQKGDSIKNSTAEVTGKVEKEVLSQNTNAIGPFHWGINDDGYNKILAGWTKQLTKSGFVSIADNKIKSNGIIPQYDKDGHLNKITIHFQKFNIHPETDYTEEEKMQIEQLLQDHNKKIKQLIDSFSEIYGDASDNNFNESSIEMYSISGVKTITQWQTKETLVALNIQNKTFDTMTGCEMEMWIELKKTN
ncbi:MAG: hypothetical protein PHT07_08790 [Paludibacter sp.]|nr:hypothetical protein [Paludibacter sp.]